MMQKIKVIIKEPGGKPRSVNISCSQQNLQKTVGGGLRTVELCSDCVVICNESAAVSDMPYCCNVCGVDFHGTIIVAGVDGAEFADIPIDFQTAKQLIPSLWWDVAREGVYPDDDRTCVGCKHYHDGEGDDVCDGCCRNYEEDCYEVCDDA